MLRFLYQAIDSNVVTSANDYRFSFRAQVYHSRDGGNEP